MSADAEKENLSPNDDRDIIPSSQGSQLIHEPNTQRLCLELEDETEKFAPENHSTQLPTTSPQGSGEKRKADGHMSDLGDVEHEKKIPKLAITEEEDMFSDDADVEIIDVSEDKSKSIEVVTLNDTIIESPNLPEGKDELDRSLEEKIVTKTEPKDQSDVLTSSPEENLNQDSTETLTLNDTINESPNVPGGEGELDGSLEEKIVTETKPKDQSDILTSSPEENANQDSTETFKTPKENEDGLVILVLKPSEFKKVSTLAKNEEHFFIPQNKIPQDFNVKLRKLLTTNNKDLMRRLSDISGLSGGSSGYNADTSSVGTGSGSSSSRDRLSIMPETLIEPHKVLSPLPRRLWPKKQQNAKETKVTKCEISSPIKIKDKVKVFAKWIERTDVKYWPGTIKEQEEPESEDKYSITFDDGFEKAVKKEDVIRADALIPGCQINVEKEEGVHQVGVLLAYPDCSQSEIFYTVQLEDMPDLPETEAEAVSYKKVHLTLDQWKNIKADLEPKPIGKKSSDVSLDNLVSGKRRSKPVTPIKTPTKKRAKKGGEHVETSAQSESDRSPTENTSDEDKTTPKRTRLPRKPLFKNLCFLLTQAKEKENVEKQDLGESAIDSETEDEEDENLEEPKFNRNELKKKILENGGKVLPKFPGEKEKIPEHVIVISDRMCRTMTYLLSVAYGFERVNFMWIQNCITAKDLLPRQNYALQVGFSSHLNRDVEQLEMKGNRRDLLKGLHILVATSDKEFGEDWKPILTRLGASVSVRTQGKLDKSLKKIDLIVGNSTPPSSIVKDARDKDLFLVTSKWVVESLINGQVIPYGEYLI